MQAGLYNPSKVWLISLGLKDLAVYYSRLHPSITSGP